MRDADFHPQDANLQYVTPCALPSTDYGALSGYNGPKGFHWLIRGWLAGMSRPGMLSAMESDLQGLARMGTKVLVTLTEEWEPDVEAIEREGIISHFFPIPDMEPPTMAQAFEICTIMAEHIAAGRSIVYHCRAGRGRTGTLLAAQMIWHGKTFEEAIAYTKKRNQLWIESESQMDFLKEFGEKIERMSAI